MHIFILIENLKERLKKFDSPPELISITINTLSKVLTLNPSLLYLMSIFKWP